MFCWVSRAEKGVVPLGDCHPCRLTGASPTVVPDRTFCACGRSPRNGGRSQVGGVATLPRYPVTRALPAFSVHGLRHTHASVLLRAGVPVVTVASRLGDTVKTVLDSDAHIMPGAGSGGSQPVRQSAGSGSWGGRQLDEQHERESAIGSAPFSHLWRPVLVHVGTSTPASPSFEPRNGSLRPLIRTARSRRRTARSPTRRRRRCGWCWQGYRPPRGPSPWCPGGRGARAPCR